MKGNSRQILVMGGVMALQLFDYVDGRGQRIEGDDIVKLSSEEDFVNDAIDQVSSPFYGGTKTNSKNRSWAAWIRNFLIIMITIMIILGIVGGLGYLIYTQYKKRQERLR